MAIVANVGPAPITGHISGHVITLATFGNQPSITLDPWCPLSVETRFLERNGVKLMDLFHIMDLYGVFRASFK